MNVFSLDFESLFIFMYVDAAFLISRSAARKVARVEWLSHPATKHMKRKSRPVMVLQKTFRVGSGLLLCLLFARACMCFKSAIGVFC